MEKICSKCQISKPLEVFQKRKTSTDGYAGQCKPCKREYDNNYYATNNKQRKEQIRKSVNELRERNRRIIYNYLLCHTCVDCNESDPIVLEFDHLTDKLYNVSEMTRGYSQTNLINEIAKCEVVCANCHKRRTTNRGNFWRADVAYAGSCANLVN